ncbi:MAG: ATP-binding protein [Luteimonas sp.]
MRRPTGLLARVGGLSLATLVLAQAVGFAVVGFWPAPPAPMMVPSEAIRALTDDPPRGSDLHVRRSDARPRGTSIPWLEMLAAERLGRAPSDVRAVWRAPASFDIQVVEAGRATTMLDAAGHGRVRAALASDGVRLPAFELAVREADGRWRVVGTADPGRDQWRRQVLLALALGALSIAPLVWWMARRLTRPLRRLAEASACLELGADGPPVPVEGAAEVRVLAQAIAQARQRLQAQAADVTGMLAAVAHDLRTPLTGLRLRAEGVPEPDRTRMVADIERMQAMIAQVLAYAQGEVAPLQRVSVDLAALARELGEAACAAGHTVHVQAPSALQVQGDALALRRALSNLIDNAARYAGDVEVEVQRDADTVQVHVRDRGPGIPAEARARLVQPFQRMEHSRSRDTGGAGLGLAVVRTVAQRHGGRLVLDARPGGGLIARLSLPV